MKILSFLIIVSVATVILYSTYNSLRLITEKPILVISQKTENKFVVSSTGTLGKLAAYANQTNTSN